MCFLAVECWCDFANFGENCQHVFWFRHVHCFVEVYVEVKLSVCDFKVLLGFDECLLGCFWVHSACVDEQVAIGIVR